MTNTATELIDYASNTYYAYFSTPATYTAASAKCASLQPVPGIVFKGTLWCIGSHSEHLLVESYFRSQMPSSFGSYWFGLRQPGMGAGAWSRYAFAWEDGSTPPSLNPSGQNYDGPGYSHWSTYNIVGSTKGSSPDPNNAGNSNQQCAAATTYHVAFSYYAGPFTTAGRNLFSNYIKDANSSRNLIGWNDRPCTELYTYICELVGEVSSAATVLCGLWSARWLAWQHHKRKWLCTAAHHGQVLCVHTLALAGAEACWPSPPHPYLTWSLLNCCCVCCS